MTKRKKQHPGTPPVVVHRNADLQFPCSEGRFVSAQSTFNGLRAAALELASPGIGDLFGEPFELWRVQLPKPTHSIERSIMFPRRFVAASIAAISFAAAKTASAHDSVVPHSHSHIEAIGLRVDFVVVLIGLIIAAVFLLAISRPIRSQLRQRLAALAHVNAE